MKTIAFAGYPKSGNTMLGEAFILAGKEYNPEWDLGEYNELNDLFDYYCAKKALLNPLFSDDLCCIKTHNRLSKYYTLHTSFYGGVSRVVTITRNPFEILLSSLNYFRYLWKKNNLSFNNDQLKSLNLLIPNYQINAETFLNDFNLEKLRDGGFLDEALVNFTYNGTSIYHFFEMSGSWCSFTKSYFEHHDTGFENGKIPILNIRYEEMVRNPTECSQKLGEFLNCDSEYIKRGFELQKQLSEERKSNGSIFFNKLESGYWKQYFDPKLCRKFVEKYCYELEYMGYYELVDYFYW